MKIFKYPLEITDRQEVNIKGLVKVLSVAEQKGNIILYAMVNEESNANYIVVVKIYGTGQEISPSVMDHFKFLGTVSHMGGDLMWHVFHMA